MNKADEGQLVLLLRSGRTAWDDEGRLQGRTDLPLSENGRSSFIAGLTHALGPDELGFPTVYHGPDEASKESAQLVAERTGAKLKQVKELGGMDVGLWDGLLDSELLERYPRAVKQWREDASIVTPPEGETIAELADRLLSALVRVLDKSGDRPVVVVLRPLGYGLLAGLLSGRGASNLWKTIEDGPWSVQTHVTVQRLKDLIEERRAGV